MAFIGRKPTPVPLTSSDITDGIISEAKMADDAISLTELKAGTDGELITWDASGNPVAVGAGTSGHYLKSQGAGSVPVFAAVSGGKILQVESMLYVSGSDTSTSSETFVDTGITDQITPSATSSKIFVMATINGHRVSSTAINSILNIERDIGGTTAMMTAQALGLGHTYETNMTTSTIFVVDSPNTTSAITYTVQFRCDNASHTAYAHRGNAVSQMILMEIGA